MPSDSGLTAAGSSTYASNTLHVGDGTWDSDRDTFLLPNLMGLNFDTMKYNGMGNRFRDMPDYHKMIIAHGILGAIAFLGLVPTSLMLIRYYSRWNPFWAFKLHVWCQVLTLFLSTIVFVLGWFAVGPKRSLSNPHHGMGLAIYVVVIFQFFWGYFVHKVERNRKTFHVPLKLVIHRWMGFTLALMGIVQIPLGLTLYGSPKVLFILFAIAVFTLLVAFFVLSYLYDNEGYPMGSDYDSRPSYVSGPSSAEEQHHHGGIRKWAGAALAGAALAKLFRRRSQGGGGGHSYSDSRSSYMDEKYSDEESHHGGWKKKLLEVGALGGAAYFAKRLFDKKRNRDDDDDDTESGSYSRAHTRSDSMSEEMLGRMEDGRRPEPTHRTPLNRPPSRPPSRPQSPGSSYYNSTYMSYNDPKPSAGNALFGAGALAAMKNLFTGRKGNAEQRRVEEMRRQEIEDEKMARANSKRYTGDGRYPPNRRDGSNTITDVASAESPRPSHEESTISPTPGRYGGYQDPPPLSSVHDSRPSGSVPPSPVSSERRHTASTPNSIELKKHKDGHNVTLRRLTEEEAAANREARRRERRNSRRRNSASSFSGNEADSQDRWRRVEELERQQQEQMEREQEEAADGAPSSLPPQSTYSYAPPPAPPPQQPSRFGNYGRPSAPPQHPPPSTNPYGSGSILSPDTFTGTEASGDYAGNRRRRRAERARARQERQQSVDFT